MKASISSAKVDGRIETAANGVVLGWAWRQEVSVPVQVEVLVEGKVVATVTADAKRRSLRRAGIGDGRHGFMVELPKTLAVGGERLLEVVVLPDRVPLPPAGAYSGASEPGVWGATRFVLSDEPPLPPEPPRLEPASVFEVEAEVPSGQGVCGVVESVSDGTVTGWAAAGIGTVALVAGGTVVAEASPNLPRPDLGAGHNGFRIVLPEAFQAPGPHVLGVEGDGASLVAAAHCLRPTVAPMGAWADADLRLALLDHATPSATAPRAVLGPGGWRFEENGAPPASIDEAGLERLASAVRGWRAAHRELSLPYVLAVLPARERLEREHLPTSLAAAEPGTLVDRLSAALASQDDDGPVDLLSVLDAARAERPVSLRTGTGLTAWGALSVARAVLAAARAPGLSAPDTDRFPLMTMHGYRGDLVGRRTVMTEGDLSVELPPSAIPAVALGEDAELLAADGLTALRGPTSGHLVDPDQPSSAMVFERTAVSSPRVLVLGPAVPPVFTAAVAETVGRCVVLQRLEPPLETIELEAPHAVLHVLRERDLQTLATAP